MISQYAPLEDLEKIARENIPALSIRVHRNGLDTMGSDAEDFFETSVWNLKEALIAAYRLGEKNGAKKQQPARKKSRGIWKQVVQCKDCEYCIPKDQPPSDPQEARFECAIHSRTYEAADTWPDNFCNYGKKKEDPTA